MKKNDIYSTSVSSLVTGVGIGIYGTGSFITTGVICPACIILTPVLIGYGLYSHKKNINN